MGFSIGLAPAKKHKHEPILSDSLRGAPGLSKGREKVRHSEAIPKTGEKIRNRCVNGILSSWMVFLN